MQTSLQLLNWSQKLYQLLLFAYPSSFRQEYGAEMQLTFRDCCLEALQSDESGTFFRFWCLVFYDFAKSITVEYAQLLKQLWSKEQTYSPFQVQIASNTDIGLKRQVNEDKMLSVIPEESNLREKKGSLVVVADGMGDDNAGARASDLAVTTIKEVYYNTNQNIADSLVHAIKLANQKIFQVNEVERQKDTRTLPKSMGTTCVAAVIKDNSLILANVGDSLAYLIRDQQVHQIAEDHSWLAEQVRQGRMTAEEAKKSTKNRNMIIRALGTQADVDVYATTVDLQSGDTLILCTDGVHTQVSEEEIYTIVTQYPPQESSRYLIERANENGGPDNSTAIVVRID
ncbi:protein phosphatase [Thermosporothrix hazakensis]|jgi:protein phosphatase|uniref:Protein phosphatase n=2 Tax=Thermosporothrix TaxID=768650 RepID=A0A326U7B4_THEHA|nr:protein phosphatase 2C domain-containing protein [Thermosporothrix hazakensis]PZW31069.1 protein phosphatase [Thermosporothrix hazakensis]BBH86714.1 hypothetical protein KTC_14650 [Thermosporothrix sp. COM3]GCE51017.1 hypothetical protein KTH_58860 [Thermosporothrix hazakensis]